MTDTTFLSEEGFCARFGISPRTAQRWRITGDGPAWVRLGQRRVGYRPADCEAWAAARTFAHRAAEIAGRPVNTGEANTAQSNRRTASATEDAKAA